MYLDKLSYNPVPGVRKSGIPAETLIPAPVITMIFLTFPLFINEEIRVNVKSGSKDGVDGEDTDNDDRDWEMSLILVSLLSSAGELTLFRDDDEVGEAVLLLGVGGEGEDGDIGFVGADMLNKIKTVESSKKWIQRMKMKLGVVI